MSSKENYWDPEALVTAEAIFGIGFTRDDDRPVRPAEKPEQSRGEKRCTK